MINSFKYYFSKNDYFKFTFLALFIYIILSKTKIFNYQNLVNLAITFIIMYFFVIKFIDNEDNQYNVNEKIYNNLI